KIRHSPAEFSFATAALLAHEYASLSRPRRLRESERIQPSSGRPFDSVYGVGLLQLRLSETFSEVHSCSVNDECDTEMATLPRRRWSVPIDKAGSGVRIVTTVRTVCSIVIGVYVSCGIPAGGWWHASHGLANLPTQVAEFAIVDLARGKYNLFLRMHNRLRSQVALGLLPGFPPAANMRKLYWNAELAGVAQAHANQCSSEWALKTR
ncbi:hypothetical protein MTO96_044749, partial [Rhipicephalus appendiculatus]